MIHRAITAAAAGVLALVGSTPILADCKAAAVDTCLVGTWTQTGGGPGEWMREHMKMAQIKIDMSNATMTFKDDGTFATSKASTDTEVSMKGSQMKAMGKMTSQGSGNWSAADATLELCTTSTDAEGSIQMQGPGGETTTMAMPKAGPSNVSMSYTCDGDTLTTVQAMPMNSKMTTTYARVR